jgi:hypothetical protein
LQPTHSIPPDRETLTATLTSLLIENGFSKGQLTVVHREPTIQGTFPKEIVTCRLADGREIQLFCKYAAGHNHNAYGHRGGGTHEATVYRELLQPMQASVPALQGVYTDRTTGEFWLILEYLNESVRVKKASDPAAMALAARWIGQFHALNEVRLQESPMPFLNSYDAGYYLGWAQRTWQYAGDLRQRFPWLKPLCERFEDVVATLLSAPPTVVHGEYYPKNILYRDGRIYPVDWESTAIGAGEIDLASLTEAWPEDIARQLEIEYQQARWPDGSPDEFQQTLGAARLYLHFRWLGDRPEGTTSVWRFEQLHTAGKGLCLI